MYMKDEGSLVGDVVEVWGLELHGLREFAGVTLAEVLLDVQLKVRGVLLRVVGFVGPITLPSPLLLFLKLLILVLGVLALQADAELPALHALFEAEAVLLLAVGFLAGAEDHILHAGLIGVDLFEVMQVLAVLLPEQLGQLMLLLLYLQFRHVFLQLEPSSLFEELVLGSEAAIATLSYHADLSRGEETTAMLAHAFLLRAVAFMRDLELGLPIEIRLLDVGLICVKNIVQEQPYFSLCDDLNNDCLRESSMPRIESLPVLLLCIEPQRSIALRLGEGYLTRLTLRVREELRIELTRQRDMTEPELRLLELLRRLTMLVRQMSIGFKGGLCKLLYCQHRKTLASGYSYQFQRKNIQKSHHRPQNENKGQDQKFSPALWFLLFPNHIQSLTYQFYFQAMSNNDPKPHRARASSAKASHDRPRPTSGNSNKPTHKIDFIENMYGALFSSKRHSNKNVPSKLGLLGDQDPSKTQCKTHKQREQLAEENLQLKREINHLKEQLCLQKGKTEQMRRKNSEFTKKLNVEYEKELYWTNTGPNMVRGVKQQYQQMKLKYEEKCLECELLTQEYAFSQAREERTYSEALQADCQKLTKRLNQAQQELKYSQHGTLNSAVQQSIELYKRYKFQIQQQNQTLREEATSLKRQARVLKDELQLRNKKIAYLDKLLIQRDNSQHATWRKSKKLQKEKGDLASEYSQYRRQQQQAAVNYQQRVLKMRESLERQSQTQRLIFRKQLQEKSTRIAKLQKQIAYLTTLLSYWKPLDEVNHLVTNNMLDNPSLADYDKQVILEYSMGSTMIKYNNLSRHQNRQPSHQQEPQSKSIAARSRKGSNDNNFKNVSELMTKSIDITKKQEKKRVQITADKRCTEEGVKSRKVPHNDIVDICETLKYRFIGFGVPIQEVRHYFDYDQADMAENQEEEQWNRTYISMREVNRTLRNQLFGLNQADALMLSRYLIEDSPNDYVYTDPNNQNLRSVVKSIIKTVVGQYSIPTDRRKVEAQASQLLQRYETNLQAALKVMAPKGTISKKKLLELFKGLGIDLNPSLQDYFLGKTVIKSPSLSTLRYQLLFAK